MNTPMRTEPYSPPPYPFDLLDEIREIAAGHSQGALDLSIGTPTDPPSEAVIAALSTSGLERGYLPSIGIDAYRSAARGWLERTTGADLSGAEIIATVGSKEFVVGLPQLLHLRRPDRDTVLYPAVSYPSYEMGAELAGCRAVPIPLDQDFRLNLKAIDPAEIERALCLWFASPGNPTGASEDMAAIAAWGRQHDVPVFSDECYVEFTWSGRRQSILEHGIEGMVAVHSLSKRSNLAGTRAGFCAGDPDILGYLGQLRQHQGLLVPGPVQAAAITAFEDDEEVAVQRQRYKSRLEGMIDRLAELDIETTMPDGGFYLWMKAPSGNGLDLARHLAKELGIVTSLGEFYGSSCSNYLRIAMVRDLGDR